jgi:hypothetical protein
MPFHIEVRRGIQRAWAFNLDGGRLRREITEPWATGGPLELGDREWDPQESRLRVLEGRALEGSELAHGRGWQSAERMSADVTAVALAEATKATAPPVAILAQSEAGREAVLDVLAKLGVAGIEWSETQVGPRLVAAVVAESAEPSADWLFEAGLAFGALGDRAILVQMGSGPVPTPLSGLEAVSLEPEAPASVQAFLSRLREAGGSV